MNRKERRAVKAQGIDVGDMEVRFGGRTLQLTVVINTDESVEEVVQRVRKAASGPHLRMAVVGAGIVEAEKAAEYWANTIPHLKRIAGSGGVA